jgi:hypothetical protein
MYAGIPGLRIPTSYILMNGNTPALLKKKGFGALLSRSGPARERHEVFAVIFHEAVMAEER